MHMNQYKTIKAFTGVDTKVSEALALRASTGPALLALRSWPLAHRKY